jgi:hypothetical protein
MNVNASIGCDTSNTTEDGAFRTIGPFGISHTNKVGYRLRFFLKLHNLIALKLLFKKKHYGT